MAMSSRLGNSLENSGDSPRAAVVDDFKVASTSSSKRSKRATQKRVLSVPIKGVEGLRTKGDQMISAPPSDSWTWRKYGQKPIKGSPYPRGYYRCSSSKGCPARKQVERSKMDPKLLQITYSYEHNHPCPASRNHHRTTAAVSAAANFTTSVSEEEISEEEIEEEVEEKKPLEIAPEYKFPSLYDGALTNVGEFGWFSDFESTSCTMFESPILATEDRIDSDEMALIFATREEDEQLFADLGELPECSTVFRRGLAQREAELRPLGLETTS